MKSKYLLPIVLLFLLVMPTPAQESERTMEDVAGFFSGVWQIEGKETYEEWVVCQGDLTGRGYKLIDGEEQVSETLKIDIIEGKLTLLATVPDQNEGKTVAFTAVKSAEDEYAFANPAHDFPKKIIYKKISPTEMLVQVLGDNDKGFSFKMIRLKIVILPNPI